MSRPIWFVKIIQHFFPDRFAIARMTKKSRLIRSVIDHFLFEDDQIFYLPKDSVAEDILGIQYDKDQDSNIYESPVEQSQILMADDDTDVMTVVEVKVQAAIEQPPSISLPSEIIRQFIDEANYVWLMDKCLCRDTMQCKEYPIDIGCIFMGEAVLKINPKLGHLATKEEAFQRLDLARESGLVHLIGKNKIDTQWMGVQPGGKLLTVCSCCPCCCLYKVLPDLDESISEKIQKMPGLEIGIEPDLCIGCGACTDEKICMTNNIELIDNKAVMGEYCVGCGRCYEVCPTRAIFMNITDRNFMDETIRRIKEKVDIT